MNILVIGNGFDLAHGLPTKYYDFIEFVKLIQEIYDKEEYERNIIIKKAKQKNAIYKEILEELLDDSIYENQYFKEFMNHIKENVWIEYFKDKAEIQSTWVDFEMNIKELIKTFGAIKKGDEKYLNDFKKNEINIRDTMKNFSCEDKEIYSYTNVKWVNLQEIIDTDFIKTLEDDLKKVIRALEIYITLFIENMDSSVLKGKIENIDRIISFNYSNTFEKLYGKDNIKYDYIHGKANIGHNIDTNDIVLGIDEYLDDKIKNTDLDFIFFKKYFQRIYKRTGCNYKQWLEDIEEYIEESNIYFYGHSLSRADKDILRDLILCDNVIVYIFYHNDEAYRNQITNLVDVIGQDKLIEKVYGGCPSIIFISTEKQVKVEIIGCKETINYIH